MSQMLLGHECGPFVNMHGPLLRKNTRMARETFVTRLADAMTKEGLKGPVQLGKRLRVNKQTASKWINGQTPKLGASELFVIADGLKVSARWLWTGDGPILPRSDIGVEEEHCLAIFKAMNQEDRQEWLRLGQRLADRPGQPATPANPYPRAKAR